MVEMSFTENTEAENSFHVAVCEIIDDKTFNFLLIHVTSRNTRPSENKLVSSFSLAVFHQK